MVGYARGIAAGGVDVVTFDFPYMQQKRRVPDPAPVLEASYRDTIEYARQQLPSAGHALFIGGKSMGGRIATHVASIDSDLPVAGLVLLGYPLHPPGRPDKRRDAHLPALGRPSLFVQGSRDTFGTPEELRPILDTILPRPTLHVVEGGDHSLKVPRAGAGSPGRMSQAETDAALQHAIVTWIRQIAADQPGRRPAAPIRAR
jgi:predicted alpha/beta-hydrolase family hydrolase